MARLLLGRSGLGKFGPDLAPVLTHVLPGDGAARLPLNCDAELFAGGSLPVHDVSKEGPRRSATCGEGLPLRKAEGLEEVFELVHMRHITSFDEYNKHHLMNGASSHRLM